MSKLTTEDINLAMWDLKWDALCVLTAHNNVAIAYHRDDTQLVLCYFKILAARAKNPEVRKFFKTFLVYSTPVRISNVGRAYKTETLALCVPKEYQHKLYPQVEKRMDSFEII